MIETCDKKDIFYIHKTNRLLMIVITLFVFLISIAYSALNSTLMVTGDLVYRVKSDIRITDVRINGVTNGGVEQYSPKYGKDTAMLGMKLPNLDSTVTYEVTIKNSSSDKYKILNITDEILGNPDISYTHNYNNTVIEANSTIIVLLTYKYNSTTLPSDILKETTLSFIFEKVPSTLYEKIESDYETGGNVELYTGDKSTFIGDKEVYYYKGATTNNNVIFANTCWQIFRTTETGGVKMIYNGLPDASGQCTSTGVDSTIGSGAFNTNYDSPADVGYMYNKRYISNVRRDGNSYLYGNSFTYSGGTYTLTNTQSVVLSSSTASSLTNKHYTCFNTTGTCATLSYVYQVTDLNVYYIDLTGGISIEKALDEMLYDDNVNTTNSTIKTSIDTWYQNNMTGYTSYLEDAIWCNDRSIYNKGGFNPNGGILTEAFYFNSSSNANNLICSNSNDRFTVSNTNGNGKLTYPVGLVTRQEQNLAYYSSNSPIQNGDSFWTLSPRLFVSGYAYGSYILPDGDWSHRYVGNSYGLRPVISLKTGIEYSSGDGTSVNPFQIIAPSEYSLYEKFKSDYASGKADLYVGDKSTFIGDKEVYYYRGETTNNNVIFAGFCWEMYRTTETGGVKMIYNGVPSSGQCTSTGGESTIGSSTFNSIYTSPAYVGYMYNKVYTYNSKSLSSIPSYLYGNSFTYSGGTYTLTNTQSVTLSSSTASSLASKHYTCWNTTGTCTTLSYVYYLYKDSTAYYINLTGGTSIEKALNEMLYDDNVNTTNSTMKTTIDTWYKNNMTGYTSYLEDTIWCNDRSMRDQSANGWNPNGGSMKTYLDFKSEGNTTNLTCQNRNDRFTVSNTNGNGKLTYPVGLVTKQEQTLTYYSSNSPIQNGAIFWTLSPRIFYDYVVFGFIVYPDGGLYSNDVAYSRGARPAVSLKTGIEYKSGDGTSVNPYVVLTS